MSSSANFYFSPDAAPSAQLFTDVQTLNALNTETQLPPLITITFAYLLRKEGAQEMLKGFSAEHRINQKVLESTVKGTLFFFNECLKRNISTTQLQSDLVNLGMDADKADVLCGIWKDQFVTLTENMVANTLKINELIDMQWKFGVTAATSELAEAGNCFLQLKLVVNKGGKPDNVLMELSLPQFYAMLNSLQKAAATLEKV